MGPVPSREEWPQQQLQPPPPQHQQQDDEQLPTPKPPPPAEEQNQLAAKWLRRKGFFVGLPEHLSPADALAAAVRARVGHWITSAMQLACKDGELWLCKWLFDHGAAEDVRAVDKDAWAPLHTASARGHLAVCQWLFDHGAAQDVRTADNSGETPLHVACRFGHLAVCQWLFDHGAAGDVRRADDFGRTPLHTACDQGQLAVCRFLFDHGAAEDVRTVDHLDATPLTVACRWRRPAVQRWLLRVGGGALLDNDQVRQDLHPGDRSDLMTWLRRELALHDDVLPLVLWGMMRPRSGCTHLWRLGDGGDLPRHSVVGFIGVEVNRAVLANLRSSLAELQAMG